MAAARRKSAPSAPVELSAPAPGLYAEAYALAERAPLPAVLGAVRLGTAGWVACVTILIHAEEVRPVFNNCTRNFAILNAKGLAALRHQG